MRLFPISPYRFSTSAGVYLFRTNNYNREQVLFSSGKARYIYGSSSGVIMNPLTSPTPEKSRVCYISAFSENATFGRHFWCWETRGRLYLTGPFKCDYSTCQIPHTHTRPAEIFFVYRSIFISENIIATAIGDFLSCKLDCYTVRWAYRNKNNARTDSAMRNICLFMSHLPISGNATRGWLVSTGKYQFDLTGRFRRDYYRYFSPCLFLFC